MGRFFTLILIVLMLAGCKKSKSYFAWERTYGKGEARFLKVTSDSGLLACGTSEGQPYLLRLDDNKMVIAQFSGDMDGVFTSALYDTSGYLTGGSTNGKMLIMRHSKNGNELWQKIMEPGFTVDQTQILRTGNNSFLAIGSASPDTTYDLNSGLMFLSFDSTGTVLNELKYINGYYIGCYEAALDNSGNIYMAITRKEATKEPKATVIKFNNELQRIWEAELSNNPDYGAASLALIHDNSGLVYVAGRTELPGEGGAIINNSFVAAISDGGSLNWKKYPENSNSGTGLIVSTGGDVLLLNINCFIVNVLDPVNGADGGRIRMFDVCDPKTTDALGSDFDIDFNGDIVLAGSLGGSFYLAVKPIQ